MTNIEKILKPKSKEDIINDLKNLSVTELYKNLMHISWADDDINDTNNNFYEFIIFKCKDRLNVNESHSMVPLTYAARGGLFKLVELLIKYGSNVNIQIRPNNFTPIMYASAQGHTEIVKLLIDNGANINDEPINDEPIYDGTALDYAIQNKNKETIDLLKKYGAKSARYNRKS